MPPGHMGPGGQWYGYMPAAPQRPKLQPPKREMDSLLEEIKAKQRLQEQKKDILKSEPRPDGTALGAEVRADSPGDPRAVAATVPLERTEKAPEASAPAGGGTEQGTCLFLRELPASITEDTVCQLFSRYGVVTAVDIVHAQSAAGRTLGYVTMDTRDNAQRSKDALQDREVDGVPLWIEWAKGSPQAGASSIERADNSDVGAPKDSCRHVVVEPPADPRKRRIIDRLAKYVAQEGHPFEQIVMERESPEGTFAFLFKHGSGDNVYYRWRTFAFAQGDNFKVWRTETFRICEGGAWWRPPPCEAAAEQKRTNFSSVPAKALAAALTPAPSPVAAPKPQSPGAPGAQSSRTQADLDEERDRQRLEERATQERQKRDRDRKGIAGGKRLSDTDWDRLEQLLRSVTSARSLVLEAMAFCLDKADWAIEITECITESLTIVETEWPLKLARLLIVSDVLHNTCSSRPAAWAYRREFEKSLPDIFEHMHISFQRMESRLQADKAREQVVRILHVWEDWGLFAPQYVRGLEAALVVGVKRLRALSVRGDTSREPIWLEPKLADWRRQHFSQLEKMCRTRGLRSSTSHLEAAKELAIEDSRREWLIDRLVTYELHWHEKEQARLATVGTGAFRLRGSDDIDGEALECDIDGFPLDETEFDGEPINFDEPGFSFDSFDDAFSVPRANSGLLGVDPCAGAADDGDEVLDIERPAVPPVMEYDAIRFDAHLQGNQVQSGLLGVEAAAGLDDGEEVLDIERPEDLSMLDSESLFGTEVQGLQAASEAVGSAGRIEHSVLRNIELEVMELRASLELQGLHRDAIEDICDEKRQRLIEDHEATLGGTLTAGQKAEANVEDPSPATSKKSDDKTRERDVDKAREREKEKDREKTKREEERAKEKDERAKEKEKDERSNEKEREKAKDRDREKDKEKDKDKDKGREKDKEKDRAKKEKVKERSRSRSRERVKKARR